MKVCFQKFNIGQIFVREARHISFNMDSGKNMLIKTMKNYILCEIFFFGHK